MIDAVVVSQQVSVFRSMSISNHIEIHSGIDSQIRLIYNTRVARNICTQSSFVERKIRQDILPSGHLPAIAIGVVQ